MTFLTLFFSYTMNLQLLFWTCFEFKYVGTEFSVSIITDLAHYLNKFRTASALWKCANIKIVYSSASRKVTFVHPFVATEQRFRVLAMYGFSSVNRACGPTPVNTRKRSRGLDYLCNDGMCWLWTHVYWIVHAMCVQTLQIAMYCYTYKPDKIIVRCVTIEY